MSVFLQALCLVIIGMIAMNSANALGVPYWAMSVTLLAILIFFKTILRAVVRGLLSLETGLQSPWPAGARTARSLALWLVTEEHLQAAGGPGGSVKQPDLDGFRSEAEPRAARQTLKEKRDLLEQRRLAEELFEEYMEETAFLVPAKPGVTTHKSHIGGLPSLPDGVEWPAPIDYPLHFLAGIYLDELPERGVPEALPRTGLLYFFLNLDDDMMTGRVIYLAEPGPEETLPPEEISDLYNSMSTPEDDAILRKTHVAAVSGMAMATPDDSLYQQRSEAFAKLRAVQIKAYHNAVQASGIAHEVSPCISYFENMVGGPKILAANNDGGSGIQVLRLDSADELGLMFGDCGVVEFRIAPEDAQASHWDRIEVIAGSC